MAAPRRLVELFYDVVSPYSWFAFEVLCRYQHIWNIDLRFRPAFLGGIMQATGNEPPGMLPKRGEYILKDIKRMGKYYQVPIQVSAEHLQRLLGKVPLSLGAMRFITAIDMTQPQFLEPVSREFWIRFWSQHEDINQPASILAVAAQAGLSSEQAQKLLEMVSSPAVKNRLRATTDDAMKYGWRGGIAETQRAHRLWRVLSRVDYIRLVFKNEEGEKKGKKKAFGMPAIVAHFNGEQHLFFGCDRIELLASIIGEKWLGPVPSLPSSKM